MEKEKLKERLARYAEGRLSDSEAAELRLYIMEYSDRETVVPVIVQLMLEQTPDQEYDSARFDPMLALVTSIDKSGDVKQMSDLRIETNKRAGVRILHRWMVAASIVLLAGLGIYLFKLKQPPPVIEIEIVQKDIEAPASNRATVTLSNGASVYLDSADNGALTMQGNVEMVKLADGQIAYRAVDEKVMELQYNTLTNPKGSQVIHLRLADGTMVWLNAGSSLKYPVAFTGNERKVDLTGEGYFEVAKNNAKKFFVVANGTTTEVIGTHFNINAYNANKYTKITLLEGAVMVSQNNISNALKPGQQAIAGSEGVKVQTANLEQVMAWKNGLFNLNGLSFTELMQQLSNWYNVEVVYTSGIPDIELFGKIGRDLNLSEVLKGLQQMGVKCTLEEKKLIIH